MWNKKNIGTKLYTVLHKDNDVVLGGFKSEIEEAYKYLIKVGNESYRVVEVEIIKELKPHMCLCEHTCCCEKD